MCLIDSPTDDGVAMPTCRPYEFGLAKNKHPIDYNVDYFHIELFLYLYFL